MKGEPINAYIENVSLTMGEHGCLTYFLSLRMGSYACAYGGYCLGHGYLGANDFDASSKGLEAMMRIMNVVGVERWEDLKGHYARVIDPGMGGTVDAIGNIIEDKWFDQREFFTGVKKEINKI